MAEQVTAGTEKMFLHHILEQPSQFLVVDPEFFKNADIRFVYKVIRDEYILSKNKVVPSMQQIGVMVKMNDVDKTIADALLKQILKGDNSVYEEDWVNRKFSSWKLEFITRENVYKAVDYIRGVQDVDLDTISDIATKIRTMFNDTSLLVSDDNDLGEDFDDPDSHVVTETSRKMSTGWSCLDTVMNGGWDQASFTVFIGETNVGKCSDYDTIITVRNKETGLEENISIGNFYDRIKTENI